MGETKCGRYGEPELEGRPEEFFERCYGVTDRRPRARAAPQTGAGHPPPEGVPEQGEVGENVEVEVETELSAVEQLIVDSVNKNTRHPPVNVPRHQSPFESSELAGRFLMLVLEVAQKQVIPVGYGLERNSRVGWDTEEDIPLGRTKTLTQSLPEKLWKPRALLWVQAMHVLEALV